MIYLLYKLAFYSHLAIGAYALIAFWLPLYGKKGTERHKRLGRYFVNAMYLVSISGLLMSLIVLVDPIGIRAPERILSTEQAQSLITSNRLQSVFLLMLSILVFCNVRQATLVLAAKANRQRLKTFSHVGTLAFLGITAVLVGILGFTTNNILLLIFAGIGIGNSFGSLRYIFKRNLKQREWILEHLGNILGCGIATYTAFFAFGGRRFLSDVLSGNWQLLPWTLPAIIGISATIWLSKKYTKQFHIS